jgi:hypothetical protein
MNCRECEELIVDALYGNLEGEAQERFDDHIASCGDCARAYREMRSTLGVMEGLERPDPGQAYWDGYWNRLTARMEREEARRRESGWLRRLFPGLSAAGARWAYRGATAVLLVVFGAVVGRMVLPGPGQGPTVVPETGRGTLAQKSEEKKAVPTTDIGVPSPSSDTRVAGAPPKQTIPGASAEACARQYIEDSQVLLLALVNFDPEVEGEHLTNWSTERSRSRELANQAASLKGDLDRPDQRRLRDLVTELEVILLQIANLETTGDLEGVDLIRSSVKDRDVMLKINLEKMRGEDTERPAPGDCDA